MKKKNSKRRQKQFKRAKFFVFLGVVATFFIGCNKSEDTAITPNPVPKPATVENILVVDKTLTPKIEAVSENEIVVSDTTSKMKEGNFIVSDITKNAPNGYLRKIVDIETKDGKKVLRTEDASLTGVIINGHVEYSKKFSVDDILKEEISPDNPLQLTRSPHDKDGFYFKTK